MLGEVRLRSSFHTLRGCIGIVLVPMEVQECVHEAMAQELRELGGRKSLLKDRGAKHNVAAPVMVLLLSGRKGKDVRWSSALMVRSIQTSNATRGGEDERDAGASTSSLTSLDVPEEQRPPDCR